MRAGVVAVVDVGVGEQEREPNLIEVVSASLRLVEKASKETERLVVTVLRHVAATESVRCGRGIGRAELAGVECPLQQGDPLGKLAAAQRKAAESELRARQGRR